MSDDAIPRSPTRDAPEPDRSRALRTAHGRGLRLGRWLGVEVHLDPSLLIIFVLIGSALALGTFPAWHPDWDPVATWITAIVASAAFLFSVLLHELSHAVVGRAVGVPVRRITLFVFGGLASTERDASSPRAEFLMTIVGPLTSLLIGVVGLLAGAALTPGSPGGDTEPMEFVKGAGPVASILLWLGPINLLLALFNLVPGFSLDGGRVLRAGLWWMTGDRLVATRWAARVGQGVGLLLLGSGLLLALGGGLLNGLWLVLLGWFLNSAARSSYQQLLQREVLESTPIRRLLSRETQAVPASMTLAELVEGPALRSEQESFPVEDHGETVGIIRLSAVREVPREERESRSVRDSMSPTSEVAMVDIDGNAQNALRSMTEQKIDQLPVKDHGRITGFVRLRDILRWLYLHEGTAG